MKQFTIILPTLWKTKNIFDLLPILDSCKSVSEILLIDNDPSNSTEFDIEKVTYLKQKENIFVNPAWNMAIPMAKTDYIATMQDDLYFDAKDFDTITQLVTKEDGLVGVAGQCYNLKKSIYPLELIHSPNRSHGFGCIMMFHKDNFHHIPEELIINCGDDYLFEKNTSRKKMANIKIEPRPRISATAMGYSELRKIGRNDIKIWNSKKW